MSSGLRSLLALICAGLIASCSNHSITATGGSELPPDMNLPELSGSIQNSAEQMCHWVESQQSAFDDALTERVFVQNVVGPDGGRYVPGDLLNVFLQSERGVQLTLFINENSRMSPQTGAEQVFRRLDGSGLYSFQKVALEQCLGSDERFAQSRYGETQLCIAVDRLEQPPANATRVDYRNLYYRISVGPMQQPVRLRVVTLYDQEEVRGRHVSARFSAGPMDVGRVDHFCGRADPLGVSS
jgi:hypothetical protein